MLSLWFVIHQIISNFGLVIIPALWLSETLRIWPRSLPKHGVRSGYTVKVMVRVLGWVLGVSPTMKPGKMTRLKFGKYLVYYKPYTEHGVKCGLDLE